MIFDKEFLRKIKFQLIDDEKTIHKVMCAEKTGGFNLVN